MSLTKSIFSHRKPAISNFIESSRDVNIINTRSTRGTIYVEESAGLPKVKKFRQLSGAIALSDTLNFEVHTHIKGYVLHSITVHMKYPGTGGGAGSVFGSMDGASLFSHLTYLYDGDQIAQWNNREWYHTITGVSQQKLDSMAPNFVPRRAANGATICEIPLPTLWNEESGIRVDVIKKQLFTVELAIIPNLIYLGDPGTGANALPTEVYMRGYYMKHDELPPMVEPDDFCFLNYESLLLGESNAAITTQITTGAGNYLEKDFDASHLDIYPNITATRDLYYDAYDPSIISRVVFGDDDNTAIVDVSEDFVQASRHFNSIFVGLNSPMTYYDPTAVLYYGGVRLWFSDETDHSTRSTSFHLSNRYSFQVYANPGGVAYSFYLLIQTKNLLRLDPNGALSIKK